MFLESERGEIVHFGRKMAAAGLTTGTGGNLSLYDRQNHAVAISPSGMAYDQMGPEDVVILDEEGRVYEGLRKPSSEWGFHLALYRKRPDICAVIHTHSPYASTIACMNREIPAVHYLVGFCGPKVPLAPYATFGTEELARNISESIGAFNAVLLANHGLAAVGKTLGRAFEVAEEIEFVARIYYQTLCAGTPHLIDDAEMQRVMEKFATYGQNP